MCIFHEYHDQNKLILNLKSADGIVCLLRKRSVESVLIFEMHSFWHFQIRIRKTLQT